MKTAFYEFDAVVAVARLGSFRAAATELGISSSALSHAVTTLERRLGARLFNRTTRSVSTTDAGEQFIRQITPALAEISVAIESINSHRDTPSGTLRLNTSLWAARMILTPIIIEFARRYPDMTIVLATDEALVDVVGKGFDAGIRLSDDVPQDMIAVPIGGPIKMMVAGAPSYFAQRAKPKVPDDLLAHQCIRGRMTSGAIVRWEFERRTQKIEMEVPGALVLDEMSLMTEAAVAGVGLTYLDERLLRSHIDAGLLIPVLEDWCPSYSGFRLYHPGRRHIPAGLRALIALIREINAK
jgi:DNA-binding transcriptional LysR family regulator